MLKVAPDGFYYRHISHYGYTCLFSLTKCLSVLPSASYKPNIDIMKGRTSWIDFQNWAEELPGPQ